jgi:hypothetical protein
MLHTMGIVRTSGSRVNSSKMPIGLCRLKLGLIDRSVCNAIQPFTRCPPMPPTKHHNITTSLGWNKNRFTPKTPMNILWEHAKVCVSLSQRRNKNANWPMQTKTKIDRLVYNAIQPVTKCPPTPQTKHQETTTSLGWSLNRFTPMRMCITAVCCEKLEVIRKGIMIPMYYFTILQNLLFCKSDHYFLVNGLSNIDR